MHPNVSAQQSEQARKFLFDLAFDNDANRRSPTTKEVKKITFSEEQMEAAKKESYESGVAAGRKEESAQRNAQLDALFSEIGSNLKTLIDNGTSYWQEQTGNMRAVALVIARKIMPRYIERHGMGEIEAVVAKVLAEMSHEPRLVFRVKEELFDEAKTRIEEIASVSAYAGKLVILGDADLGSSECRIEWADGGIERDLKVLWQAIDDVMKEMPTPEPCAPLPSSTTIEQQTRPQQPDSGEEK